MRSSLLISLLFSIFLFENCAYYAWKKQFIKEDKTDEVQVLSLLGTIENPNQELYLFLPGASRNLGQEQFIESNYVTNKTSKPKIIMIHGWNPLERDTDPFTSRTRKIDNIKGTFFNGILHYQENLSNVNSTYELYLFTYRTSSGIIFNGDGFLKKISRAFVTSDQVIVIAHSMGGLITRAAMKSNDYVPGLIDGVITLGSPMHGSPFASKQYLGSQNYTSEVSSFLLQTQGGADLAHTNVGTGQTLIENETNVVLDYINKDFSYNTSFITFSGVLTSSCLGAETFYYTTACNILTNSNPSFPLNDGIVPENSAFLGENGLRFFRKSGYDHSMMAFQTLNIDSSKSTQLFKDVIEQANFLLTR